MIGDVSDGCRVDTPYTYNVKMYDQVMLAACRLVYLLVRRDIDKEASLSWGFQTPSERKKQQQLPSSRTGPSILPQLPGKLYEETAASQHALKREAQSRRLHDKEFRAKQSIRKRQQEYDQAVKARLAQEDAQDSTLSHTRTAKYAQQQLQALQGSSGVQASPGAALSGPRARKLQAFARQPRPPQLPAIPKQLSRIPDDVVLPDICGIRRRQSGTESASMVNLIDSLDDGTVISSYQPTDLGSSEPQSDVSSLPKIATRRSSIRRLTQEMQL